MLKEYMVKNSETYQYKQRYNINKHVNKNEDMMMIQWLNNICTGEI